MGTGIKVIHIISSLRRGGRERQLAGILKHSDENILNRAIVFNKAINSYEHEYNLENKLIYLHTQKPLARFLEMLKILKHKKPDIIWTWGGFEATFGMFLSFFTSVKHINGSVRHGIVLNNWKHIWRTIILHFNRNIVANSYTGLSANRLKRGHVIYNGLDDQFFSEVNKEEYLLQQPEIKKLIDKRVLVLISVANLIPYKDYFTVLKALAQLKNRGFSFIYLIIGEGPDKTAIENDIQKKSLESNVILTGRRQDVKELLSISDIFIHSSKGEGCSNAILEAMAAGLPVIASDTGGTSEIIHEDYGRLFEYKNQDQLLQHLIWLFNNPDKIKLMGSKARETAKQRFSVKRMLSDYAKIISEITSKKSQV